MEERIEKIIAFASGDLLVTLLAANNVSLYQESWHFLAKAAATLAFGAFGGLGGLLIRDAYPWIKRKVKKWILG
jgi:hypothetical protein